MYQLIKHNLEQNIVASLPSGGMGLLCYAVEDTGQKKQNHQRTALKSPISPSRRMASTNQVVTQFFFSTLCKQFPLSRTISSLRTFLCKRQNQFSTLGSMEVINTHIP